jgi:hypothetical protein
VALRGHASLTSRVGDTRVEREAAARSTDPFE